MNLLGVFCVCWFVLSPASAWLSTLSMTFGLPHVFRLSLTASCSSYLRQQALGGYHVYLPPCTPPQVMLLSCTGSSLFCFCAPAVSVSIAQCITLAPPPPFLSSHMYSLSTAHHSSHMSACAHWWHSGGSDQETLSSEGHTATFCW